MIEIIPGVLEKEWVELAKKVKLVAPYVEWVQIDFADGTLVPATTNWEFPKFAKLIKPFAKDNHKLSFEAHLMVASPEKYLKQLVDSGFRRIIAHVEANEPRLFLDQAQYESIEVGLAIDGPTELEQIEPFLEEIDVALVMLAEAGPSGQELQPENVEKVRSIRQHFPDLPIEVDQGINDQTAKLVRDAGATRFVSTSYIFKMPEPGNVASAIESLKQA